MREIPANLLTVAKKRSRNPELAAFGGWLKQLRDGMSGETSREWVSLRLADQGVSLGGSTLAQYEKGTVWAPDIGVLHALSKIYDVAFDQLARGVRENRRDTTLSTDELVRMLRADAAQNRADSSHAPMAIAKKIDRRDGMTHSGTPPDVELHLSSSTSAASRGNIDAAEAGEGTADRLSESEAANDAQVERNIDVLLRERTNVRDLVDRLRASADTVRAVADLLQSGPPTQGAGATGSADVDRHASGAGRKTRQGKNR